MIKLNLFGDELTNLEFEVTKYVNNNLEEIVRVLIDLLEDNNGFTMESFLPYNNFRIENQVWQNGFMICMILFVHM